MSMSKSSLAVLKVASIEGSGARSTLRGSLPLRRFALLGSCLIVLLAMSAASAQFASAALFGPKTDFKTGLNPISVSSGDFNGDKMPDLAVANARPGFNKVSVLLGNGSGGFGSKTDFPTGASPFSVANADFNGDGKLDLSVANYDSDTVSVLLGNGTGVFGPKTDFLVGDGPYSLITDDFNGDSKPDLAVTNDFARTVSVLLGDGSGGFAAKTDLTVGGEPRSLTSADFNGDGKPDLAVANGIKVVVLLGDGSGGFAAKTEFAAGKATLWVTSDDFNGDNKPDFAVVNIDDKVSVLLGDGSGGFGAAKALSFPADSRLEQVASADFNGDGKPDLAVTGNTNEVSVSLGNGNGSFAKRSRFVTGRASKGVISDDFNGDGKPDLAVANARSESVSILLGDGSPDKAKISKVKVSGPGKAKKGKMATYKVKITTSGNANPKGVVVKVSGKGISLDPALVGEIPVGKTTTVKLKLKPKKPGKVKVKFKVRSSNAGGKTVKKKDQGQEVAGREWGVARAPLLKPRPQAATRSSIRACP